MVVRESEVESKWCVAEGSSTCAPKASPGGYGLWCINGIFWNVHEILNIIYGIVI